MKQKIIKAVPLLVFVVLLVSTFIAWRVTQNVVKAELRQNFDHHVQISKYWMQDRLNLYLPIALGMRIFFEAGDEVTTNEWSTYIQKLKLLDNYPAISSIIYIDSDGGKNGDTYLVKYAEPLSENKEIIGLNLSSDQKQLELLNSVRDEDPTSKGRVTLITTAEKGFKIILPVYRKGTVPTTVEERRGALKGFVQVEFAGNKLFQDIFDVVDSASLNFEVYSSSPKKENLLYNQNLDYSVVNPNYKPEITTRDAFDFNSQTWYLVAVTKPDFKLTPSQRGLPLVVLGSGLFFSFIFLGTYLYLQKHDRRAS